MFLLQKLVLKREEERKLTSFNQCFNLELQTFVCGTCNTSTKPPLRNLITHLTFDSRMGRWTRKPTGERANLILPPQMIDGSQIEELLEPLFVAQQSEVLENQVGVLVMVLHCISHEFQMDLNKTIEIEFNETVMSINEPVQHKRRWFPTPPQWKRFIQYVL